MTSRPDSERHLDEQLAKLDRHRRECVAIMTETVAAMARRHRLLDSRYVREHRADGTIRFLIEVVVDLSEASPS